MVQNIPPTRAATSDAILMKKFIFHGVVEQWRDNIEVLHHPLVPLQENPPVIHQEPSAGMNAICFHFRKMMLVLCSFLQSGRWSSKETLLKCFTIPPAFLTPEEQTGELDMWTVIAFSDFVRNELPRSHNVRLITIWPCLFSLSSTLFFSNSSH